MKFIVDSLPRYESECPFEDKCPNSQSEVLCPRLSYKQGIDMHRCYWLKEVVKDEHDTNANNA